MFRNYILLLKRNIKNEFPIYEKHTDMSNSIILIIEHYEQLKFLIKNLKTTCMCDFLELLTCLFRSAKDAAKHKYRKFLSKPSLVSLALRTLAEAG